MAYCVWLIVVRYLMIYFDIPISIYQYKELFTAPPMLPYRGEHNLKDTVLLLNITRGGQVPTKKRTRFKSVTNLSYFHRVKETYRDLLRFITIFIEIY